MEVCMTGSQMAKLGNFKDTMTMVCPDLNGRLTDAHQVLGSNVSICTSTGVKNCRDRVQRTTRLLCGTDGGYMIPIHSKNCQELRIQFEKLVNLHGKNELIPVFLEKDAPNFHLNREVKSEEIYSVNDAEPCLEVNAETKLHEKRTDLLLPFFVFVVEEHGLGKSD